MIIIIYLLIFVFSIDLYGMKKPEYCKHNKNKIQQPYYVSECTRYGKCTLARIQNKLTQEIDESEAQNEEGKNKIEEEKKKFENYKEFLTKLIPSLEQNIEINTKFDKYEMPIQVTQTTANSKTFEEDYDGHPAQRVWILFLKNINKKKDDICFWTEYSASYEKYINDMNDLLKLSIEDSVILFGILTGMRTNFIKNNVAEENIKK